MKVSDRLVRGAQQGDLRAVVAAIESGADPNARGRGLTALHWAAQEGHFAVVKELIAHGAHINAKARGGITPLHQAVGVRRSRLVNLLIRHGADVNAFSRATQSTPLHTCCAYGYLAAARILVSHGADTTIADDHGRTPLYWAGVYGHREISDLIRSVRGIQLRGGPAKTVDAKRCPKKR